VTDSTSAAQSDPMFKAQLVSLNNARGRLGINYNWLYSALNCTPATTGFYWTVSKLENGQVSLSPSGGYGGMTPYASVRDDNGMRVEVQAPNSADWITGVGGDEMLTITSAGGLLIVRFAGFNGQYLTVDDTMTEHDEQSGYLLSSANGGDPRSHLWLLFDLQLFQPLVAVVSADQASDGDMAAALVEFGMPQISVSAIRSLISN